jgi:hypothetical protein
MSARRAIQFTTKRRRAAVFGSTIVAILSVPMIMSGFGAPNPNNGALGFTGAPGQGTCASCHGTLTTPSMVTVTGVPASYTAGAAVSMTVSIPSTGGFELTVLTQSGNAAAGTLAAGTGDAAYTVGALQYVASTTETTSWTFSWTPPAATAGTVVLYVTGGTHNVNYSNSYVIPAASTGPPSMPTLNLSSTGLTFTATVGGTAPSQTVMVTTSDGSAQAFSASPGASSWLMASPATGTTPATETISINTTGLVAGTYNGAVTFTSSATSPTSVMLPVTLTVTSTTPPPTTGATFSFVVVDRQSGGSDWLLLYGSGSVSSSNTVTGSGSFTRFRGGSGESEDGGSTAGATIFTSGTIVLQVQLTTTTPSSSTLSTGTLTISSAGTGSATLAINGGDTFNAVGIGTASITSGTSGGGGGGGGDDDHPGTGNGGHDN